MVWSIIEQCHWALKQTKYVFCLQTRKFSLCKTIMRNQAEARLDIVFVGCKAMEIADAEDCANGKSKNFRKAE